MKDIWHIIYEGYLADSCRNYASKKTMEGHLHSANSQTVNPEFYIQRKYPLKREINTLKNKN